MNYSCSDTAKQRLFTMPVKPVGVRLQHAIIGDWGRTSSRSH